MNTNAEACMQGQVPSVTLSLALVIRHLFLECLAVDSSRSDYTLLFGFFPPHSP